MARKVFISVLGSTNYFQCKYQLGNFISNDCFFVQIATLDLHKVKETWNETDRCYILLTKGERGSKRNNWNDCPEKHYEHGLKYQLAEMKLPCPVIPKEIDNEFDIWEIFNVLYGLVEEDYDNYDGYELYIDITHSFRYIPMLLVVFANFAKFMRQTTVKSITYGNWEARNPETNIAPFIDLTPLVALQAWTAAADQFLSTGAVDKMSDIMNPITTFDAKNPDKRKAEVRKFMGYLRRMIGERQTCQGYDIIMSDAVNNVKTGINKARANIKILNAEGMSPFERILDKIDNSVSQFNEYEDVLNVFRAADWCHRHGMHQQALTLVREGILTYLMDTYEDENTWFLKYEYRENFKNEIQEEAYKQNPLDKIHQERNDKSNWTFRNYFQNESDNELAEVYIHLTDIRNQYNHGGMLSPGKTPEEIIDSIETSLQQVKNILDY